MKRVLLRSSILAGLMALSLSQAAVAGSQYIDNMPQLAPDPGRAGAMTWLKPGVNRAVYTKVMIEPITIFISPDSEYKGLNADELQKLAAHFQEAITKALEPEVPVINEKGPGVLYLRAALTNVKVSKVVHGLLGYTPVGFLVTTAAGPQISLKDATLEIEMLDSMSGERLGVLVDRAPRSSAGEALSWDSINKTLVFYAERFKSRLEAARKPNGGR